MSESQLSSSSSDNEQTYEEFLRSLKGSSARIRLLHELITSEPQQSVQYKDDLYRGEVNIVSQSSTPDELIHTRLFTPDEFGPASTRHVADSPGDLHLVIYSYYGLAHMSRHWLEELGSRFKLDPFFLFNHLAWSNEEFGPLPLAQEYRPCTLASRRVSLDVGMLPLFNASIVLVDTDYEGKQIQSKSDDVAYCGSEASTLYIWHAKDSSVILILLKDDVREDIVREADLELFKPRPFSHVKQCFNEELATYSPFTQTYINILRSGSSELNVANAVLSFFRLMSHCLNADFAAQELIKWKEFDEIDDPQEVRKLEALAFQTALSERRQASYERRKRLAASLESMNNLCPALRQALGEQVFSTDWQEIIGDFNSVLEAHNRARADLEDYVDNAIKQFNLTSTFISRTQGMWNRALSMLALIFLPLSFVTSFFGMNVEIWIGGNAPALWIPVVTGVSLLAGLLLLISFVPVGDRALDQYRFNWSWALGWRRTLVLTKFALFYPILAFWLMVLVGSFEWAYNSPFTERLGLDEVLLHHREWSYPTWEEHHFEGFEYPYLERKIRQTLAVTRDPDWPRRTLGVRFEEWLLERIHRSSSEKTSDGSHGATPTPSQTEDGRSDGL